MKWRWWYGKRPPFDYTNAEIDAWCARDEIRQARNQRWLLWTLRLGAPVCIIMFVYGVTKELI